VYGKRMLRRLLIGISALLACAVATLSARAEDPASARRDAEHVVHLLAYVAADYGAALEGVGGPNEAELAEQLEVLDEAARHAQKLRPAQQTPHPTRALEGVQGVRRLVDARRPAKEVEEAAHAASRQIAALYDLAEVPAQTPSRERGVELYELHCSACHGSDGRAETPRAAEYTPRPANFHSPDVSRKLSPLRVFTALRFGVPKTAMAPFDFLSDAEKWDVAFYVRSLDHAAPSAPTGALRLFSLAELARQSDEEIRGDLERAGFAAASIESALDELRTRAPYDPGTLQPTGAARSVLRARAELRKVSDLLVRDDREGARMALLRAYLDEVEPLEAPLKATDPALAQDIEERFKQLRRDIADGGSRAEIDRGLASLSTQLSRAGRKLDDASTPPSFVTTMLSSAGIALREGVEAALLIAALLAVVSRAGNPERKRWVHAGWISAAVAGAATWFASRYVLKVSGLSRELIEGASALLAATVLFYVSYWLFAKRETARWVSYLRGKASSSATLSLFGIAFLAVYREAFETVIFYQALVAQPGSASAAGIGALLGLGALIAIVVAYGRAGRFAPPRSFFTFSSLLLYALAVVFAGQGISALQTTGHLPFHPVRLPHLPALGVYSTLETYCVQAFLIALAIGAALVLRSQRDPPAPPGRGPDRMAGSREGAKL
jgi:high-affinity iron transporter